MSTQIYRTPEGRRRVLALYDDILAGWPVPLEKLTLKTSMGDTFAIAWGPLGAPPLVLVHGAGSNSGVWLGESQRLARVHRVFALDLPGEAGRSCEVRAPWTGSAYGTWLLEALDRLGLQTAVVLGFSQGGWTALKAAVAAPERFSSLVLLSPGGITRDRVSFALRAGFWQMCGRTGTERIKRMVFGSEPLPPALDAYVVLTLREFKPRMGVLPLFDDDQLRRLTMPVLVLVGSEDRLRGARGMVHRIRHLLPGAAAEIVPGGAHALTNAFDRVEAFLSENRVRRHTK
jgi:pimeloyl-ACP methyl ester carboxylesterase